MSTLLEDSRSELVSGSKHADNYKDQSKGKNRYERRLKSKVANSVKEFNMIDMNRLFKDNILDVSVKVQGETHDYLVKISFGSILDEMKRLIGDTETLNYKIVLRSLIYAFNSDNVYVSCSCEDFRYRFGYWLTVKNITSGQPEHRPSDITNPNDTKGRGCKHILLVLSNASWLNRVSAVIYNYINYMKNHQERLYADIIYPAIFGKKYNDNVQLDIDNSDELTGDADEIAQSQEYAKTKTQFKPGNEYRFTKDIKPDEQQFNFKSLLNDDEYDIK